MHNKYFATRCKYGDLGIWGANRHPDKVIKILNIDDPDYPQYQEEIKPEPKKKKRDDDDEEYNEEEEEEEEEEDEDGNKKKKAPEPEVV